MKKIMFGVFAHPDDEAFGPSAYLYRQAQEGVDVHLVLVTDGDAGRNNGYDDLASQRLQEWRESGRRLGTASGLALHYPDGQICNNMYLEIANKTIEFITKTCSSYDEQLQIELITFDENGVTGHLDHVAVSFITTYVYEKLRVSPPPNVHLHRLLYYCLPETMIPRCSTDWIYMPAGRKKEEIDFSHPFHDIADKKMHIMLAHESQKNDMEEVILAHKNGNGPAATSCLIDHFIVRV